jgi:hypothetical protein
VVEAEVEAVEEAVVVELIPDLKEATAFNPLQPGYQGLIQLKAI